MLSNKIVPSIIQILLGIKLLYFYWWTLIGLNKIDVMLKNYQILLEWIWPIFYTMFPMFSIITQPPQTCPNLKDYQSNLIDLPNWRGFFSPFHRIKRNLFEALSVLFDDWKNMKLSIRPLSEVWRFQFFTKPLWTASGCLWILHFYFFSLSLLNPLFILYIFII